MTIILRGRLPVLMAVVGLGAACRPSPDRYEALRDSIQATPEFQARRDSFQRLLEGERHASRPVEIRSPTVVAFYPDVADSARLAVDTFVPPAVAPFIRHLEGYRAACAKAGFRFEVRDSRGVHVRDPRRQMLGVFGVEGDSVGLVIAIPGQALHVWYGLQLEASLPARLRALLPEPRKLPVAGT